MRGLLLPCLLIRNGGICLPGPEGPVPARDAEGHPFDILDVADQLGERYGRMYVVDLDGWERDQPQLDYLQEIARAGEVWVDAGVRTGEQAIDVVVAGAFRTVLSTSHLDGARELTTAWKLSPEIAFEVRVEHGSVSGRADEWSHATVADVARQVRTVGVQDVVYTPATEPVDWALVRTIAPAGPLWVGGSFRFEELDELQRSGAAGGIFQLHDELGSTLPPSGRGGDDRDHAG